MNIIGREKEQYRLSECLESGKPEFIAVYGRRRVGKTYLVREYFDGIFSFYTTGLIDVKTKGQLKIFGEALNRYGYHDKTIPKDWFEAFERLKELLQASDVKRDPASGRKVVFLDEVPWMDTARSDFRSALDYFWNSWGSAQPDLILIVCGSATSWIVDNILNNRGGFYNRVTCRLHLNPFNLSECRKLLESNGHSMTMHQILECYMVFGGIPYYLNCLSRRLSLGQNIDNLCFSESGELRYEYEHLFRSLFRHADKHLAIIELLAERKSGMSRKEIASAPKIGNGESLTKTLRELEECGFIRSYKNYTKPKSGKIFQLIDPFVLFALNFINDDRVSSWIDYENSPGFYAWRGNAFEMVCLNHIKQIKTALGISGMSSSEYSWRSARTEPGVQIDLLIDRRDDIVNLCEMKCTDEAFSMDEAYERQLIHKVSGFRSETGTKKAVHITLISASGVRRNAYLGRVQSYVTGEDLFRE